MHDVTYVVCIKGVCCNVLSSRMVWVRNVYVNSSIMNEGAMVIKQVCYLLRGNSFSLDSTRILKVCNIISIVNSSKRNTLSSYINSLLHFHLCNGRVYVDTMNNKNQCG